MSPVLLHNGVTASSLRSILAGVVSRGELGTFLVGTPWLAIVTGVADGRKPYGVRFQIHMVLRRWFSPQLLCSRGTLAPRHVSALSPVTFPVMAR